MKSSLLAEQALLFYLWNGACIIKNKPATVFCLMICKLFEVGYRAVSFLLPVGWLAGFPTNCGFMRAFKEHIFKFWDQKPQQIGKIKAGFLVMVSLLNSPWMRRVRGEAFNKERNGSFCSHQRQTPEANACTPAPRAVLISGSSLEPDSGLSSPRVPSWPLLSPSTHLQPGSVLSFLTCSALGSRMRENDL